MRYEIPKEFRIPDNKAGIAKDALTLEWLGTAGFRIEYGGKVLIVDPYVTRPRLPRVIFARMPVNKELCREVFPKADFIFIGHSHFDHLQDAPEIAVRTGAKVFGSKSTATVCRAYGLPENKINIINPWDPIRIGDLSITCIPGLHGKIFMGRVPSPGEITSVKRFPMRASQYRLGDVFGIIIEAGGFRILHAGSANLNDEEMAKVGKVNVLLLCLAGRKGTPDYVKRMMAHVSPDIVIPHHSDNFFKPLKKGYTLLPSIGMDAFIQEAREEICPTARLLVPGFFEKAAFDIQTKMLIE
jgi:L-ascorbate metabolism protein UlaG (beta-lactamase superfamily)